MKLQSILLSGVLATQALAADYAAPVALQTYNNNIVIANSGTNTLSLLPVGGTTTQDLVALPASPNGFCIDGDTAYVSVGGARGKLLIVDLKTKAVTDQIAVGHTPMAPVKHGNTIYVPNRFSSNISVIDLATKKITNTYNVPREPIALALSPDGSTVWVANHLPSGTSNGNFTAAQVSRIQNGQVVNYSLTNGSQGVRGLCISPDGKYVVVAHVIGRYQVPTTQLDRGWMNTNAITVIDTAQPDKAAWAILLDDTNQGAANPWAVRFTPDGKKLLATHAGTHEVSIIDFPGLLNKISNLKDEESSEILGFLTGLRTRVKLPLNGPRSVATDGKNLYAAGYFSDNVIAMPLEGPAARPTEIKLPGNGKPQSKIRLGEQYFNDAAFCFQEWQSCATCHPDSRVDGLNWDLLNDGMGNPKNTRTMFLSHRAGNPVMTLGVRASADVAVHAGFVHIQFIIPENNMDECVSAYLKDMKEVPSPWLDVTKLSAPQTKNESCLQCHAPGVERGTLTDSARRGKEIFKSAGCVQCHPHPAFTNKQLIATGTPTGLDQGKKVLVPSLVEVWRTAPYMHDGRSTSIKEVITTHNQGNIRGKTDNLTEQQLDDLVNYVRSL